MLTTNLHVHTPYSFSCFDSIEQLVTAAKEEGIAALGINDNITADGFNEFAAFCDRLRVYPLFNIEFLVRCEDMLARKTLRSDAAETGFMYLCGKALFYPLSLPPDYQNLLTAYWRKTQDYIWTLIDRLNGYLGQNGIAITLDYNDIRKSYAKRIVNERHVVKALYNALRTRYDTPAGFEAALVRLFGGISFTTSGVDPAAVQNEIFTRLLKKDKTIASSAHMEQYLRLKEAHALILAAGGVPCYALSTIRVDKWSECETDAVNLAAALERSHIFVVDFFPLRTEPDLLRIYARIFSDRNFIVTFGTGHNGPERPPLVPRLSGNEPFDEDLSRLAWEGACLLAAHQEMRRQNKEGIVNAQGTLLISPENRKNFISIGEQAIKKVVEI